MICKEGYCFLGEQCGLWVFCCLYMYVSNEGEFIFYIDSFGLCVCLFLWDIQYKYSVFCYLYYFYEE